MSLFQISYSFQKFYITIALLSIWTGAAAAQNIYVLVNDTSRWAVVGNWTHTSILSSYSSDWLYGTQNPQSTILPSLTLTFDGTVLAIFGSVLNGTSGVSLGLSTKIDDEDPISPTYTPQHQIVDGFEQQYSLFTRGSLSPQNHTFTLTMTGETSPFFLQGAVYTPTNTSALSTNSTTDGAAQSPSTTQSSSNSNDSAKLGGAIGGGLGALLLVGLIIFFMMRRIRRIESDEKKLQARPFIPHPASTRSIPGTNRHTPSASATNIGTPMTRKKESSAPSSDTPLKRPLPSSSNSAPSSRVYSSPYSAPAPTPHRSPAPSVISVPSEYQATTVGHIGGTAVASSYIGTTPLPEDMPPVPPLPVDVKRKSKASRKTQEPPTPSSGLGLFSSDSLNSVGTAGSSSGLSRPLPVLPGTRSAAPVYSFPPEKVGLTPAPPRRQASTSKKKRPLPDPS